MAMCLSKVLTALITIFCAIREGHAPFWVKLMGSASEVATYIRCMWRVNSEVM